MRIAILLAVFMTTAIVSQVYWVRAVLALTPEGKRHQLAVWLRGPLFTPSEFLTPVGETNRNRSILVGGGGLLLFLVLFFFVRGAG